MRKRRRILKKVPREKEPLTPSPEGALEEAAELLPHQEPPVSDDPAIPMDHTDPLLIDPAD